MKKMNNLAKRDANMALIGQAFGTLDLPELPSFKPNQSLIPRKFTKWRLKDEGEMIGELAIMAENTTRIVNARVDMAISILTAGDKAKLVFRKNEHEHKVMELTEASLHYDVVEKQKKCELLDLQIQDERATQKMKFKELGYDNEDENR